MKSLLSTLSNIITVLLCLLLTSCQDVVTADQDLLSAVKLAGHVGTRASTAAASVKPNPVKQNKPKNGGRSLDEKKIASSASSSESKCIPPNCPEVSVTYRPSYPPLGHYSISGYCDSRHSSNVSTVTLHDGETLSSALKRLLALGGGEGGVIEIPWNVKTYQCDVLKVKPEDLPKGGLTLKGIPGPLGEQPRFYCRADDPRYDLDGTIPRKYVQPKFFNALGGVGANVYVVFENLHIDGYKGALALGSSGHYIVRNSYFHHGPHSGIASTNTGGSNKHAYKNIEQRDRFSLAFCGSEISHYGQGNHTHNFYMHRALGGGGSETAWATFDLYDTWSEVVVVDSFIHSSGWSSAFKSIANKNILLNNRIYSEWRTDPGYRQIHESTNRFSSQMLIDIPSCSINIIKNNFLVNFKHSKSEGGSALVGLRNRRTAMRGCDIPLAWYPYKPPNTPVPPIKQGPVHSEKFWRDLNKKIFFPTYLENNVFVVAGEYARRQTAIRFAGSYWFYEGPKKVSCQLPAPSGWYERSRVFSKSNIFIGFRALDAIYKVDHRSHNSKCVNQPKPSGPGPAKSVEEVIEVIEEDKYYFDLE